MKNECVRDAVVRIPYPVSRSAALNWPVASVNIRTFPALGRSVELLLLLRNLRSAPMNTEWCHYFAECTARAPREEGEGI